MAQLLRKFQNNPRDKKKALRRFYLVLLGMGLVFFFQKSILAESALETLENVIENTNRGTQGGLSNYHAVGLVNILEIIYGGSVSAGWFGSNFESLLRKDWGSLYVATFFWVMFFCVGSWMMPFLMPKESRDVSIWCRFPIKPPYCGDTTKTGDFGFLDRDRANNQLFSYAPMFSPAII